MARMPRHICLKYLAIVLAIQVTGGAASVFGGRGINTTASGENPYRPLGILKSISKSGNSQKNFAPAIQKQFDWRSTPVRDGLLSAFGKTKRGVTKVLTIEPKIIRVPDATKLSNKAGEPSIDVHLANARLQKHRKKFDLAARSYSRVLDQEPHHLQTLVEFGRLLDRQNRFEEAIVYYRQACAAHPKEASPQNDLALCYARQGSFPASLAAFREAIKLDPNNSLYRNNLAVTLVDQNQLPTALVHLIAAHGPAIGHYNLAFLLHQRGKLDLTVKHLQTALLHDSQLDPARQMLAQLRRQTPAPNQERNTVALPTPSRADQSDLSVDTDKPPQQPTQTIFALSESAAQDQDSSTHMFSLTDWNATDTAVQTLPQHGSSPTVRQPLRRVRRFEPEITEPAPLPRGEESSKSMYSKSLKEPTLPTR